MSQANVTKSYHLCSACRISTIYIKSPYNTGLKPTVYTIENEENFTHLIWLPTTPIFSDIFWLREVRIKGIKKKCLVFSTELICCKQKYIWNYQQYMMRNTALLLLFPKIPLLVIYLPEAFVKPLFHTFLVTLRGP